METEIKKIKSLEELDSLVPGDKVFSFEYENKEWVERIATYEGIIDGKYAFMQQLVEDGITSWRNDADELFIGDKFSVLVNTYDIYTPDMDCFQSKLNLIKGTK